MAKLIQASGTYKSPQGEDVNYPFEYLVIDSIDDAIAEIGEEKVKSNIQRMLKLDANNISREKAKIANGHSTRKPMSEEQKAQAKIERQANRDLLAMLKAKGITAETLASL